MPPHHDPREYAERIAEAHGPKGYYRTPDGRFVYAAYRDGEYELLVEGERLTDTDGDLTTPRWLDGRGTLLAMRDESGAERHDLVEVDPETGDVTPILDDEFDDTDPIQSPTDPDRLAFVSTRDRSLDLYTTRIGEDGVTKRSTADEMVAGFDWSPDGDRLVYQAGMTEGSSIRVVDLTAGTDRPLVDEPDSEQTLGLFGSGHHTWSEEGIVFTTNHRTGYREIGVADPNGDHRPRFENERDKYVPRWLPDGEIAFVECRTGNHALRIVDDGDVTTVREDGVNSGIRVQDGDLYYHHADTSTVGTVYRNGEPVVEEGVVDLPTVAPEPVTYRSFDDLEIPALQYEPEGEARGAVVKAHGGPEAQHFNTLDPGVQTLVREGFAVLAPDVRGSTGYGRGFRKRSDGDLGGDDLRDLVAAADYLREAGHDRVGITGGSYGGYMTLMGVAATDAFDAGASVCGVVNWETIVENARGYVGDELMRKLGGTPDERPEFYEERSPITHVDDVSVPLLVVQGANDPRVPESEAEQIVSSLEDRDVPCEYLLFEDEGHGVIRTENRVEYIERVVSFFEDHL